MSSRYHPDLLLSLKSRARPASGLPRAWRFPRLLRRELHSPRHHPFPATGLSFDARDGYFPSSSQVMLYLTTVRGGFQWKRKDEGARSRRLACGRGRAGASNGNNAASDLRGSETQFSRTDCSCVQRRSDLPSEQLKVSFWKPPPSRRLAWFREDIGRSEGRRCSLCSLSLS